MAEVENLSIVIDVVDSYSEELGVLFSELETIDAAAEAVDNITIDVDVRDHEIDALFAKLTALEATDFIDGMDIDVNGLEGVDLPGGRGGGGDMGLLEAIGAMAGGSGVFKGDGDSLRNTSRAANNAADALEDTADSSQVLDLRMTDLHNALAKAVPLLLVFIGAIPALLGAFVALGAAAISAAAALAAIGGFGALGAAIARGGGIEGMGEGFEEIMSEIQDDFLDAFVPLAEQLAPAFEDALDGLDRLFQNIANRGDTLVGLTEMAREFGGFMLDFLPNLLDDMGKMADAFGPLFADIMDVFDFSVLGALTQFMSKMTDEFITFLDLMVEFLPVIGELSIGFLRVVNQIGHLTKVLSLLINFLWKVITVGQLGGEALGMLAATFLTGATAALIFGRVLGVNVVSSIIASIQALKVLVSNMLIRYVSGVSAAAAATMGWAVAIGIATAGLSVLLAGLTFASKEFLNFKTDVQEATDALREFDSVGSSVGGPNPFAEPEIQGRQVRGSGTGSGGDVNITVEGDADEDTIREQGNNAMYRMERPQRQ